MEIPAKLELARSSVCEHAVSNSSDSFCSGLDSELDTTLQNHFEQVMNLTSINDGPLNTDDDLQLELLKHRYHGI
jgi:hypothetical protein